MSKENPALWWQYDPDSEEETDKVHEEVFQYAQALEDKLQGLRQKWFWNAKLYDTRGELLSDEDDFEDGPPTAVSENYVKSAVDTLAAMVARNRPRPVFVTDGAEWSVQRRAKKLGRYSEGQIQGLEAYKSGPVVFRDAELFGTGVWHPYECQGKIKLERVWIGEILVDEKACRFTFPKQIHRKKIVDRDALKAKFVDEDGELDPEIERAIDEAQKGEDQTWHPSFQQGPDQIWVIESWKLPSYPGADDGRHAISIQEKTLVYEVYERDWYPFIFLYYTPPVCGFYGTSLVEEIAGTQLRIHKTNKFIDLVHDRVSVPRAWVHVSDLALAVKMNRVAGQIVGYKNRPPVFQTATGVSGDVYQRQNDLKKSIFETSGVSQLSATSRKPAELESAKALREFNDIEAQRFALLAQRYEEMFLDLTRHIIRLAAETHEEEGEAPASVWRSRSVAKKIEWSEVAMDEDAFVIDIEASSILSRTPAGRKADVQDLFTLGLIDGKTYLRLMGMPDLAREVDLETAALEDIEATLEEVLDLGEDDELPAPEPFQDLELGVKRFTQEYLLIRHQKAPRHVLENLRTWIELAEAELKKALEQANQDAAQAAGAPPAPGGAVPPQAAGPAPPAQAPMPGMGVAA